MRWKLNVASVLCYCNYWAMFVVTDLEKYTSYKVAIKSNIQLNESFNFATDFKGSRTVTSKLQAPEHTKGSNFQYKKFGFITKLVR